MTLSASEVNKLKHAPAVEGVLPAVHGRWSARAFEAREVGAEDLKRLFEAARWAPSSANEQPWRFVVGVRGTRTHEILAESLMGFNKLWASKAPVLVVGVGQKHFAGNGKANAYALYDLGAATMQLVLQAHALGLTSHQMGGFDRGVLREKLGIPEEYEFGAVVALGYQAEPASLGDETLIAREVAPRSRKPLEELVFAEWGEPAEFVR